MEEKAIFSECGLLNFFVRVWTINKYTYIANKQGLQTRMQEKEEKEVVEVGNSRRVRKKMMTKETLCQWYQNHMASECKLKTFPKTSFSKCFPAFQDQEIRINCVLFPTKYIKLAFIQTVQTWKNNFRYKEKKERKGQREQKKEDWLINKLIYWCLKPLQPLGAISGNLAQLQSISQVINQENPSPWLIDWLIEI